MPSRSLDARGLFLRLFLGWFGGFAVQGPNTLNILNTLTQSRCARALPGRVGRLPPPFRIEIVMPGRLVVLVLLRLQGAGAWGLGPGAWGLGHVGCGCRCKAFGCVSQLAGAGS